MFEELCDTAAVYYKYSNQRLENSFRGREHSMGGNDYDDKRIKITYDPNTDKIEVMYSNDYGCRWRNSDVRSEEDMLRALDRGDDKTVSDALHMWI